MTGDEAHWRGLGHGLRILLERRVVQLPFEDNVALYEQMSPLPPDHRRTRRRSSWSRAATTPWSTCNVARDFVESFRRRALAPIYYVRTAPHPARLRPHGEPSHVVDHARGGGLRRIGDRPAPSPDRGAARQLPVAARRGARRRRVHGVGDATDVAARRGTFYVVSADNAFSTSFDPRNERASPSSSTTSRAPAVCVASRARPRPARRLARGEGSGDLRAVAGVLSRLGSRVRTARDLRGHPRRLPGRRGPRRRGRGSRRVNNSWASS